MSEESKEEKGITLESESEMQPVTRQALSPFEEMDRAFNSIFKQRWMHPMHWEMPVMTDFGMEMKMPRIDVIDRDNEILVRAETAGVKKDDLDVSINHNSVTIRGETCFEEKEERGNFFRSEISSGTFCRTVALPGDVDADKATAAFHNGILELTIPKIEKSKRRTIQID